MDQLGEILSVANQKEKTIWVDTPSQISMIGGYLMSFGLLVILGALNILYGLPWYFLIIPVLFLGYSYLLVRSTKYELTTQRFRHTYGILNQKRDQMELYRIKDYRIEKPIYLRILGLSNIYLDTSDKSCPVFKIVAIDNGDNLVEEFRKNVERRREERFIRELDVN